MAREPLSKYDAERLAFFKKTRRSLKQFDIDPTEGSGWTTKIGMSTPFPADEEFESTEDSGTDEAIIEPPPTTPLPPPSEIFTLRQSSKPKVKSTPRPDLYSSFYGAGPKESTRVQAMQWIPTRVSEDTSEVERDKNVSGLYGSIIIVFARPSKLQEPLRTGAMYVYKDNTENMWNTMSKATSVGGTIKLLRNGELFSDSDGDYYKDLHSGTIDPETGSAWALWIFDDAWGLRDNNGSVEYRGMEEREKKIKAPIKRRFD
jgi:hypothetical protein